MIKERIRLDGVSSCNWAVRLRNENMPWWNESVCNYSVPVSCCSGRKKVLWSCCNDRIFCVWMSVSCCWLAWHRRCHASRSTAWQWMCKPWAASKEKVNSLIGMLVIGKLPFCIKSGKYVIQFDKEQEILVQVHVQCWLKLNIKNIW